MGQNQDLDMGSFGMEQKPFLLIGSFWRNIQKTERKHVIIATISYVSGRLIFLSELVLTT